MEFIQAIFGVSLFVCLMRIGIYWGQSECSDYPWLSQKENDEIREEGGRLLKKYLILAILIYIGIFLFYQFYYVGNVITK